VKKHRYGYESLGEFQVEETFKLRAWTCDRPVRAITGEFTQPHWNPDVEDPGKTFEKVSANVDSWESRRIHEIRRSMLLIELNEGHVFNVEDLEERWR
jgi:hypothetical protein